MEIFFDQDQKSAAMQTNQSSTPWYEHLDPFGGLIPYRKIVRDVKGLFVDMPPEIHDDSATRMYERQQEYYPPAFSPLLQANPQGTAQYMVGPDQKDNQGSASDKHSTPSFLPRLRIEDNPSVTELPSRRPDKEHQTRKNYYPYDPSPKGDGAGEIGRALKMTD